MNTFYDENLEDMKQVYSELNDIISFCTKNLNRSHRKIFIEFIREELKKSWLDPQDD